MCGIVACFSEKKNCSELSYQMLDTISHRGPDGKGFFTISNLSLGSCRLSIMDLSEEANMPVFDKSGRYVIVYNGEIYNFLELKKKYKIETKTSSDTELLIELYVLLKERCLDEINGIFSFIIFDQKENLIFCARDRMGIKPFYYFFDGEELLISSEIKSFRHLKKDLDHNCIKTYLQCSFYDFGQQTFFKKIKQLKPSHYFQFSLKEKKLEPINYWQPFQNSNYLGLKNENDIIELGSKLILDSFKMQMQTDTNLAINVSSGIDSKLMLNCLNQINNGQGNIVANSFFFDEIEYNEKPDLEKFASSINWEINFFKITSKDIHENFDKMLEMHDGPFPGVPTIAKSLLIQRSSKKNYKVILEGQGGDDIAGGYKYIFGYYLYDLLLAGKFNSVCQEFIKFSNNENEKYFSVFISVLKNLFSLNKGGFSADGSKNKKKNIYNKDLFKNYDILNNDIYPDLKKIDKYLKKIIYRDLFYTKLQRILKSCDRASMMNGKELRVPLLNHNLVEFFFNLDNGYFIKNGHLRYIYRKILYNLNIKSVPFEKKKYVSDPQVFWLKNNLFDWAYSILDDSKTYHDGIFNTKNLLKEFEKFKKDPSQINSNFIWQALCLKRMIQKI